MLNGSVKFWLRLKVSTPLRYPRQLLATPLLTRRGVQHHPVPPGPQRHPRAGFRRDVRGGILLLFALQNDRALSLE